ncbi:hypothetical protein L1987_09616 [Smallanthus sonchifolius]|uniref:Uncharacterized protein n=1 Tax=Smallanthus sonchifolius TaxID=185202 RepID=A0ACB9JPV8_9ASTR|nr:hypothetical protein L1987_09616 [Smallanthus sonchifolius]
MARTSLIPGFRFHPTDVELVMFYLKRKLLGKKITVNAIAEVNIYDFSPWDLRDKSSLKSGDLEWYFFCPKAKKYSNGSRFNRATESGFWKATGKDRNVKYNERTVATIKTLVFHLGHAGKGQRTDWVMHEYKMEDEHLAKAGIVQDMYVLCKVYEKSGSGPKNGAHYGAPFNEEEWDDDLASCIGSGLVGASNKTDNAQKGLATMSVTEPGSSIVTFSADQPIITLKDKQKSPAAMTMTEPGSSIATFSSTQHTKTPNGKQKGPAAMTMTELGSSTNTLNNKKKGLAAMTMTEPGSSIVSFSSNQPTNTLNDKQKGPAAMTMTEPGSSVTFSADQPTNTLNDKQKGPAAMNMAVPQTTYDDVIFFEDVDLPADVDMLFEDDLMFFEDIDLIMGLEEDEAANVENVKSMVPNEDDSIYDDLVDLIDLEDLKKIDFETDGADYTLDRLLTLDDLDDYLGEFYVD